jgi:DNA-binding NarL/FixJ family response regulator
MKMKRPSVLLVDDHEILIEGLKDLLQNSFDVVGTACNGQEFIRLAKQLQPMAVVADISMPEMDGIEAVLELQKNGINTKVIFLSMYSDVETVRKAFGAGASAYVPKSSDLSELVTALNEVLKEGVYISPKIGKLLVNSPNEKRAPHLTSQGATLSARQLDVLQLVARGHTMKEVAAMLGISPRTAEAHKYQIMELLGVKKTVGLVQFAFQNGLLPVPDNASRHELKRPVAVHA